jgi:hypothetical protein
LLLSCQNIFLSTTPTAEASPSQQRSTCHMFYSYCAQMCRISLMCFLPARMQYWLISIGTALAIIPHAVPLHCLGWNSSEPAATLASGRWAGIQHLYAAPAAPTSQAAAAEACSVHTICEAAFILCSSSKCAAFPSSLAPPSVCLSIVFSSDPPVISAAGSGRWCYSTAQRCSHHVRPRPHQYLTGPMCLLA